MSDRANAFDRAVQGRYDFLTDWEGKFSVLQIPAGRYRIEIAAPGCRTLAADAERTSTPAAGSRPDGPSRSSRPSTRACVRGPVAAGENATTSPATACTTRVADAPSPSARNEVASPAAQT